MARAAERGDLRVAKWLYKNGAAEDITKPGTRRCKDSGEIDREDETPVLLSCKGGHVSVCQWLCEVGAADDISKADDDGMTPFLWACQRKHLSVCQWLVQEGADTARRRFAASGAEPKAVADNQGSERILRARGSSTERADTQACSKSPLGNA